MNEKYHKQVELLLEILPFVMKEECFALKGGTAINFFLRDIPRLSVDIDLVYLPLKERTTSLQEIDNALMHIKDRIKKYVRGVGFSEKRICEGFCIALSAIFNDVVVKIEPNTVLRGTVFKPSEREISGRIKTLLNFHNFMSVKCLSMPELYGGKLVAALDRQHPRDIFDIKLLLDNEGITDDIRKAFVVYLASHHRPMHEVLKPNPIDIKTVFNAEFVGMINVPVTVEDLENTRINLFEIIPSILNDSERRFLISIKEGRPEWKFLNIEGIKEFPAIQWKLRNIKSMNKEKHLDYTEKLKRVLL